jgi:hypothetical protein
MTDQQKVKIDGFGVCGFIDGVFSRGYRLRYGNFTIIQKNKPKRAHK